MKYLKEELNTDSGCSDVYKYYNYYNYFTIHHSVFKNVEVKVWDILDEVKKEIM